MANIRDNFTNFDAEREESSTNVSTTMNPTQPFFDAIADRVHSVYSYYTPLLVVLGTIGNLVSVFVFYSSKLRLQSTSQYLSALAISDTIFLLQLVPPWLVAVDYTDVLYKDGFCQIFVYVSYVTSCISAWLVVAFTIERFVAVIYPLQRNAVCTIRRARFVICTITIAAIILDIPVLRFAVPSKYDCNIDDEYLDYAEKFNIVDTVVSFSAPMAVIILLNTWIMIGVYRLERARRQLLKAEQPPRLGQRLRPAGILACPRSQQRVTRMLVFVSSIFVILNMPAYTMRVMAYMSWGEDNGHWAAVQQISQMFFNTNFGINFILYCLSGQNFRRALKQTVPWLRRKARRAVAVRRATSSQPGRTNSVSTSFVSNCTEATTNCTSVVAPDTRQRRRDLSFITRWTFDNTRQNRTQQQPTEQVEMRPLPPVPATSAINM